LLAKLQADVPVICIKQRTSTDQQAASSRSAACQGHTSRLLRNFLLPERILKWVKCDRCRRWRVSGPGLQVSVTKRWRPRRYDNECVIWIWAQT